MTQEARYFPDEAFRIRAGIVIGWLSIIMGVYAITTVIAVGLGELLWLDYVAHQSLPAIVFGVFALLAVPRQPFNNSVWTAVWGSLAFGVGAASSATTTLIATFSGIEPDIDVYKNLTPADLPPVAGVLYSLLGLVLLGITLIATVGTLLFPNGELPSRRWRWVVWGSILTGFAFVVALGHEFRPTSTTPIGSGSSEWTGGGRYIELLTLMFLGFLALAVFAASRRYRKSEGLERQQFRWLTFGGGLLALILLVVALLPGGMVPAVDEGVRSQVQVLATFIGFMALMGSYAMAVGKYRLYDIDIVISRTFVYGALGLFITAVYIAIVVGLGRVLDTGDGTNIWLGIAATVVIAIVFQPLRRRLQRIANRIVYGRRATPYEVLSSFSQQLAAIDPGVLGQVARMLTEGTTASAASIWVVRQGHLHRIAAFPEDGARVGDIDFGDEVPGASETAEVVHHDESLGVIALELPAGQPFPPTDRSLLDQVASGMGLALRNLQLTEDLRTRVDQLRESRRRVVAVQDQTRQMLERDLHDGAQQRLVALKIKIGIGAGIAEKQHLGEVRQILETVKDETDMTIESLRNLARGIYPPLLESEGLGAALTAQARRAPLPVTVQAVGITRQPREIEATVYFCVLEAIQNSLKHAGARSVLVTLADDGESLSFEVRDDGVGFDVDGTPRGQGLQNMADRLDSINGTLQVSSQPGHGTALTGRVPIRQGAQV